MFRRITQQLRILHPERLPFKGEGEIEIYLGNKKVMGFVSVSPDLQKMLKIFLRKNETIQLRNLDLYEGTESIRKGINKSKIKYLYSQST